MFYYDQLSDYLLCLNLACTADTLAHGLIPKEIAADQLHHTPELVS